MSHERCEHLIDEAQLSNPSGARWDAYVVGYLAESICQLEDELKARQEEIASLQEELLEKAYG